MNRSLAFTDGHGFEIIATLGESRTRVTKLDGWWGGAEPETEWVDRLGDGGFASPMRRKSRKITLGIREHLDSPEEVLDRSRQVSGIYRSGEAGQGVLHVLHDPDGLTALGVGLAATPRVARSMGACILDWEVELICNDPYLYGPLQSITTYSPGEGEGMVYPAYADGYADFGTAIVGQGIDLKNYGNQVAWPLATVRGSFPSGFRLEFSGQMSKQGVSVIFAGDVNAGFPCVVDLYSGRVVNGDADQSFLLAKRVWGGVNPGGQCTAQLTGLGQGSGSVDIQLRSTYA